MLLYTKKYGIRFALVTVGPPAPNKNKTNPRENLEFVLFITREFLDLKSNDK